MKLCEASLSADVPGGRCEKQQATFLEKRSSPDSVFLFPCVILVQASPILQANTFEELPVLGWKGNPR
jgi:hypothetical protein